MTERSKQAHPISKAIAVAIVIAAVSAAIYIPFAQGFRSLAKEAKALETSLSKHFGFGPTVIIGTTTVVVGSGPIMELSTIQKRFSHEYSYTATFLGSTKQLKLKGTFIAKAGYDMTKPFTLNISENGKRIDAKLPPAQLNSVEQIKVEVVQDKDGFWNKITSAEREDAMNRLFEGAKSDIATTSILKDADAALTSFLDTAIRKNFPPTTIVTHDPEALQ